MALGEGRFFAEVAAELALREGKRLIVCHFACLKTPKLAPRGEAAGGAGWAGQWQKTSDILWGQGGGIKGVSKAAHPILARPKSLPFCTRGQERLSGCSLRKKKKEGWGEKVWLVESNSPSVREGEAIWTGRGRRDSKAAAIALHG